MIQPLRYAAFMLTLFVLSACAHTSATPVDATYYLVRHAEKVLDVKDPRLTDAGTQRANDLSARLSTIDLDQIYSSNYRRTKDTAAPTAKSQNIPVTSYDAGDLEGLASLLLKQKGNILVVGHSNTTPQLADLLGGEPGEPIIEATEYNRFYIVTRRGAAATGIIETYGN